MSDDGSSHPIQETLEDPPHRLRGGLQVVGARRKGTLAAKLQERFMHQRRGIERLAGLFRCQLRRRELAEFIVDLRQQFGGVHFFSGDLVCGYFARSARHFLTSPGLLVAVYNSIRRSRASGSEFAFRFVIAFSRRFIPW